MIPSVSGSRLRPAIVGLCPLTICRYSGSEASPPNIAVPMTSPDSEPIANVGMRNRRSGSRASSPKRRSASTNSTSPTTPPRRHSTAGAEVQPHCRPCSARTSSGTRPTVSRSAPGQSIRCGRRVWGMLSTRWTTTKATRPMGTLTRNTHRQPVIPSRESVPAKKPPTTGPRTLAVPKTARKNPWYRARSRGGTMSPTIASARENSPPAPRPWTARNRASSVMEVANELSTEPSTKMPMAVENSGLRP